MSRADPYRSHRFIVEVHGLEAAGFAEVEGLGVTAGVFADQDDVPDDPLKDKRGRARLGGIFGAIADAAERATEAASDAIERASWIDTEHWPAVVNWTEPGTSNPPPRQRRAEFPLLTLGRGVTDSTVLETWIGEWIAWASEQRGVRIMLLDSEGREARGWECRGVVPVRWSGPTLQADRESVAMESLELAHAGITPMMLSDGLTGRPVGLSLRYPPRC